VKVYYKRKRRGAASEAMGPNRRGDDGGYLVRFGVPSRQKRRKSKRKKKEAMKKNGKGV
jgi:hypothetical protein